MTMMKYRVDEATDQTDWGSLWAYEVSLAYVVINAFN